MKCSKEFSLTVGAGLPVPKAYWNFDELVAGTRTDCIQGIKLQATGTGNVPVVAGKINRGGDIQATVFLVTDQPVDYGDYFKLPYAQQGFSVTGWFFPITHTLGTIFELVTDDWNVFLATPFNEQVQLFGAASTGIVPFIYGQWNFFRFWYDPTDSKLHLRINEDVGSEAQSGVVVLNASTGTEILIYATAGANEWYQDEAGIWMPALSDAEAALIYNAGAGRQMC